MIEIIHAPWPTIPQLPWPLPRLVQLPLRELIALGLQELEVLQLLICFPETFAVGVMQMYYLDPVHSMGWQCSVSASLTSQSFEDSRGLSQALSIFSVDLDSINAVGHTAIPAAPEIFRATQWCH